MIGSLNSPVIDSSIIWMMDSSIIWMIDSLNSPAMNNFILKALNNTPQIEFELILQ